MARLGRPKAQKTVSITFRLSEREYSDLRRCAISGTKNAYRMPGGGLIAMRERAAMMATLEAQPPETHILITGGEDTATIYTEDRTLWPRLSKLGRCFRKRENHGRIVAREFILPVSAVLIGGANCNPCGGIPLLR